MARDILKIIDDFRKKLPFKAKNGVIIKDFELSADQKKVSVLYADNSKSDFPLELFLMAVAND